MTFCSRIQRRTQEGLIRSAVLEDVREILPRNAFDLFASRIGSTAIEELQSTDYALIHRYEPTFTLKEEKQEIITEAMQDFASLERVKIIMALLRLIRPTRESAQEMHGYVLDNGTLDVRGFHCPLLVHEVPQNQKLFSIRDQDIRTLVELAPTFLNVMRGDYWEVRMAVEFHQRGHFQTDAKARYLLWMAAIEGLFTSVDEQGSALAKARIRGLLGDQTSVYPAGELHDLNQEPHITVRDIVDDLYLMRNCISHGDRLDNRYFAVKRLDLGGELSLFEVLTEAASFIIRHSLLKILRENLIEYFTDSAHSAAYFASIGLSREDVYGRAGGPSRAAP